MIIIYDHHTAARALALPLDAPPRAALMAEIALLTSGEHDLTNHTAVLVVQPGDTTADVAREAGLPLPLAGWDLLTLTGDVFRLVVTYGSTFATVVLIPDDERTDPRLLDLCRRNIMA